MTAPLRIQKNETALPGAAYGGVARDILRILWRRKLLMSAMLLLGFLIASSVLVLIGPRYSGEAMIQLNFIREEPAPGTRSQPMAALDAVALVDGAARAVRSRATARAVVARFALDTDPDFTRESITWRMLSALRAAVGLEVVSTPPRDLAINQLMRRITVTNDPRSYSLVVVITMGDPERATSLANAVAQEYLRSQLLQQTADARAAVERELAQLSSVYGVRHPSYIEGRTRLENLQARLSVLSEGTFTGDSAGSVAGQSLIAAERVMVPSGPNIPLIIGLAVGAALAMGIWLALLLEPPRLVEMERLQRSMGLRCPKVSDSSRIPSYPSGGDPGKRIRSSPI
jgi:uncharacterized protein involved in exopolysaccharide biosynthesis